MSLEVAIRAATVRDSGSVARLHADSWRRYYRGSYSDLYLDGDLDDDRMAVWSERLAAADQTTGTLIAERSERAVGFVHVQLDADPKWGALIDNFHVDREWQRNGIGTRLLEGAAQLVAQRRPESGIYLWVLERNTRAQGVYLSRGGRLVEWQPVPAPRGDPRNLAGSPRCLRVAWPDPAALTGAASHPDSHAVEDGRRAAESRIQRTYDAVAPSYDSAIGDELTHKPLDRALLRAFLELAGDGLVADVGCGPGHITRYAGSLHPAVLGIDLSPEMIRIAREHDPDGGYLAGSMLALPADDGIFSGVIALYSIIHFTDEQRTAALAELARVTRPGGWLYLAFHVESDEVVAGGVKYLTEWFGQAVDLDGHFLDPATVAVELEATGFGVNASTVRQPDPDVEYPSRRCYLIAQRAT
jgi:ubiquinone/menaquinone biosynthesis C-methylase UbiE/ribosomal protein S18 acetylase RimI-like enzyme